MMHGRLAWASSRWRGATLCGLLSVVAVLGLRELGALQSLELAEYDWQLRASATSARAPPVVLVLIGDDDIAALGNEWPMRDAALARLLDAILAHEPAAVGVDLIRDAPVPPGSEALQALLLADPRIIVAMSFGAGDAPAIPPPEPLIGTERAGFIDVVLDVDGVVRRGLLFLDDGRSVELSLALRLALTRLAARGVAPQPDPVNPAYLRLGDVTAPPLGPDVGGYVGIDTRGYQFLIDYREPLGVFPTYSASTLLSGRVDRGELRDAVVLIGVSASSVKDHFLTPLTRGSSADVLMPGVELQARIVSQILRWSSGTARPLRTLGETVEALWIAAWCALGVLVGYLRRQWVTSVVAGVACIVVLAAATRGAFVLGWWLPAVPGLAGWLLAAGLTALQTGAVERHQRRELMGLFARHVSPELAELIWSEREQLLSGGRPKAQRLTATVLFSDIRGYTSVSEGLSPDALLAWLNEYMEAMAPHVAQHGGVVLRFFGDAVLAVFGAPIPRTSRAAIVADACNAIECALAMGQALATLNADWERRGLPAVATRIGIHTGEMVGGSLGSAARLEYVVQGDAVNTAQRLESLDKEGYAPSLPGLPCRVLVGEPTAALAGERYLLEPMGTLRLRGKSRSVQAFRLLGRAAVPDRESAKPGGTES